MQHFFGNPLVTLLIIAFGAFVLYFMPFLIAWARHHRQVVAIFWSNFFFGWTGIGWAATFVWAVIR